ncbi:MAG: rRNA maturation RNase YbeY [Calditrichaeota bacterium]|nr:MAG: rRNA maturation RNase YbeY [Calditrichota bacterium]
MNDVFVQIMHPGVRINESAIKEYTRAVLRKLHLSINAITIVLVDNEYLRQLHAEYLGDDSYTDIMTFPLHEPGEPISADIVISVDMAEDNAQFYQVPVEEELRRLIIHGLLHLSGMDDATGEDQKRMREKENELLQTLPFGNDFLKESVGN